MRNNFSEDTRTERSEPVSWYVFCERRLLSWGSVCEHCSPPAVNKMLGSQIFCPISCFTDTPDTDPNTWQLSVCLSADQRWVGDVYHSSEVTIERNFNNLFLFVSVLFIVQSTILLISYHLFESFFFLSLSLLVISTGYKQCRSVAQWQAAGHGFPGPDRQAVVTAGGGEPGPAGGVSRAPSRRLGRVLLSRRPGAGHILGRRHHQALGPARLQLPQGETLLPQDT